MLVMIFEGIGPKALGTHVDTLQPLHALRTCGQAVVIADAKPGGSVAGATARPDGRQVAHLIGLAHVGSRIQQGMTRFGVGLDDDT